MVVGSHDKHIYVLDMDGNLVEKHKVDGPVLSESEALGTKLFAPVCSEGGLVELSNKETFEHSHWVAARPKIIDNVLVFGSIDGFVYLVEPANLSRFKKYRVGERIMHPIQDMEGNLLVPTDRSLHMFRR